MTILSREEFKEIDSEVTSVYLSRNYSKLQKRLTNNGIPKELVGWVVFEKYGFNKMSEYINDKQIYSSNNLKSYSDMMKIFYRISETLETVTEESTNILIGIKKIPKVTTMEKTKELLVNSIVFNKMLKPNFIVNKINVGLFKPEKTENKERDERNGRYTNIYQPQSVTTV